MYDFRGNLSYLVPTLNSPLKQFSVLSILYPNALQVSSGVFKYVLALWQSMLESLQIASLFRGSIYGSM